MPVAAFLVHLVNQYSFWDITPLHAKQNVWYVVNWEPVNESTPYAARMLLVEDHVAMDKTGHKFKAKFSVTACVIGAVTRFVHVASFMQDTFSLAPHPAAYSV